MPSHRRGFFPEPIAAKVPEITFLALTRTDMQPTLEDQPAGRPITVNDDVVGR